MSKKIFALDSQRLDAIQTCMYYYDLRFQRDIIPIHTADYLERGGLLHEMLAVYYNLKKHRSRWAMNNKNHADIVQSCVVAGRKKGTKLELSITEIERTIEVFIEYTDFYENDDWSDGAIEFVEAVGSKVLYDSEDLWILYEVKIDLGLRKRDVVMPIDHKHAKARKDPNELANQFKGYCWFLGSNNITINEVGFQKTVKPTEKFRRHTIQYSDAMISEWVSNTIDTVKDAIDKIEHTKYIRNYTSCDKYSGCIFKSDVCMQDPEVREYKLKELFKIKTWDVGAEHL